MQKTTKVLLVLSAGLLLAGVPSGFAIHYNKQYNDLKNSEQVQSNQGLLSVIEELQASLKSTKSELTQVTAKLNNKTAENEANKALVEDLKLQVESLNTKIKSLDNQVKVFQDKNADLAEENEGYVLQISILEAQILELQNEVTRLNGLVDSYGDLINTYHEVVFKAGERVIFSKAVESNTMLSLNDIDYTCPEDIEITGWKLSESGDVLDEVTITEDTVLYAEYIQLNTVNFYLGDTVLDTIYVHDNTNVYETAPKSTSSYRIDGYTNSAGIEVDLTSHKVVEDTELHAVYSRIFNPTEEESSSMIAALKTISDISTIVNNYSKVVFAEFICRENVKGLELLLSNSNSFIKLGINFVELEESLSNLGLKAETLTFNDIIGLVELNFDYAVQFGVTKSLYVPEGVTFEGTMFDHISTGDTTYLAGDIAIISESFCRVYLHSIYKNSAGEIIKVNHHMKEFTFTDLDEFTANRETLVREKLDELYNTYGNETLLYV